MDRTHSYQYSAQIQDPTAITACLWCQFAPEIEDGKLLPTLPGASHPYNLILSSSSKLFVYYRKPESGLRFMTIQGLSDVLFGRIHFVKAFRRPTWNYDVLFVLTESRCCFLKYDEQCMRVQILHQQAIDDRGSLRYDDPIVAIDPTCSIILMHIFQSSFEVIRIGDPPKNEINEMISMRACENNICALCFLPVDPPHPSPILVAIYGNSNRDDMLLQMKVKAHMIDCLKDTRGAQNQMEWQEKVFLEKDADLITSLEYIPALERPGEPALKPAILLMGKLGRLGLLTADNGLMFISQSHSYSDIVCCVRLHDRSREVIIGDSSGQYGLIDVDGPRGHLRHIGKFSPGSCLAILSFNEEDSTVEMYVASRRDDSQLVEFNLSQEEVSTSVLSTYSNIGPVIDFCVVDENLSASFGAPGRFFTCSGSGTTGSLRIADICIGVETLNTADSLARAVFTVYEDGNPLVLTSLDTCSELDRIVRPSDRKPQGDLDVEMEADDADLYQFDEHRPIKSRPVPQSQTQLNLSQPTIWCGNTFERNWVQITENAMLHGPLNSANVSTPQRVVAATNFAEHLVVGLEGAMLLYFDLRQGSVAVKGGFWRQLNAEISCVTVDDALIAVACWDFCIELYKLPSPQRQGVVSPELVRVGHIFPTGMDPLAFDQTVVRSLLLRSFESAGRTLFAGFSGGILRYYKVGWDRSQTAATLSLINTACLGRRRPAMLYNCDPRIVLVCAQQPVFIHCKVNGHLAIDKLNLNDVTFAARVPELDAEDDAFVFLYDNSKVLVGAVVDKTATLFVRTAYVGNSPSHIAFHKTDRLLCIAVQPTVKDALSNEVSGSHPTKPLSTLQFFDPDDRELRCKCMYQLNPREQVVSLLCANLTPSSEELLFAGAVTLSPNDDEPKLGRVMLLRLAAVSSPSSSTISYSLQLETEIATGGAVYSLKQVRDKLVGTVNNAVIIWSYEFGTLIPLCKHEDHIAALHLDVMGDLLLVGDMMRGACLLRLKELSPTEFVLEEVGRNWNAMWLTAAAIQSPNSFIGVDDMRNFITFKFDETKNNKELEITGKYNCGEFINRMQRHKNIVYWASIDGALGFVRCLEEDEFGELLSTQNRVIQSYTESAQLAINHAEWRSFKKNHAREDHKGFIDGDLLQAFVAANDPSHLDEPHVPLDSRDPSTMRLVGEILEKTPR